MSAELFLLQGINYIISLLSLDFFFLLVFFLGFFLFAWLIGYFSLEGYCNLILVIISPLSGAPLAEIHPHKGNHSA